MKKISIIAIVLFMGQSSWAQIRDYQTTRLLSTSGAGVASVLSTEAAVLNPSSAAFFDENTVSTQFFTPSLSKESDARTTDFSKSAQHQGYFITDNDGPVKGGLSYITQKENSLKRERMGIHAASMMGKNMAMGINYQYIQDTFAPGVSPRRDFSHTVNAGFTYILSEDLILGLVARDLTRTLKNEEKAIVGLQYSLTEKINLIADYSFLYTKAYNKRFSWAVGTQLTLFKDFFVRGGLFEDQMHYFKGYSWGASWLGPRLGVEFAQRFSEQTDKGFYVYNGEKIIDTSLSLLMRF